MSGHAAHVPRYIGLVRGINVGGKNKVPMGELRSLFEALGCTEVSTFIQSGNVLFSSQGPIEPTQLQRALAKELLINTAVVLRTPRDLRAVVERNPYQHVDPSTLHVGFLAEKPSTVAIGGLETARFAPEECIAVRKELYLHLPNGMARAKLPAYLERRLKIPITIRNWNTVTELLGLAGG